MITTDLTIAANALNDQNIIGLPTETVYGLAGNAYSKEAIAKIFALKQRPLYNPLIVHIRSVDFLTQVAVEISAMAMTLANAFWPGPLTLVLKKKTEIPDIVTAGKDTVAVRVPNHPMALALLSNIDFPLAAPSANPFGSISPTSAAHVSRYFADQLDVILDGGNCQRGIESTIIGFENGQPIVYRLGSLSIAEIESKVGSLRANTLDDAAPKAPGMGSRHYAPATKMLLTDDVRYLSEKFPNKKIGVLVFKNKTNAISIISEEILSEAGDLEEAAKNLYAAMHRLDNLDLDLIIAERLPDMGIGKTLNDKLKRATKQ